jgi:ubiquinone/menaquinone biosynthesis C-methylase UbiE
MLARVLEPEVMDSPQDAADYDAMDHSEVNRLFAEDFRRAWQFPGRHVTDGATPGEILDLGTGTALIPIELCRLISEVRIRAVDAALSMLELAERNVRGAGLEARIALEQGDAKRLPYPDQSFAAVISNSILHHIPEPGKVLSEAVRVLAPGGMIFFRDLVRPSDEPTLIGLVETYAGTCNAHQRQLFADSLRAALTVEEVRELVAPLGFPPSSVAQTSDRHWTWIGAGHASRA